MVKSTNHVSEWLVRRIKMFACVWPVAELEQQTSNNLLLQLFDNLYTARLEQQIQSKIVRMKVRSNEPWMSRGITHGDGLFEDSPFLNFFLNNKFDFDSSGMWFSPNKWCVNKSDLRQGSFQFFYLFMGFISHLNQPSSKPYSSLQPG